MYDKYDERAQFLSWTSNQTTERWYLPKSREEKYIKDLLKRFKFNEGKIAKTPISTSTKLDKDEKGKCVGKIWI